MRIHLRTSPTFIPKDCRAQTASAHCYARPNEARAVQATVRVTGARPEVTPAQRGTRAPPIGGGPFRPLQSTPGRVSNIIVFTVERCAGDADEMHPAPPPVAAARHWQAHRIQPRVAGRIDCPQTQQDVWIPLENCGAGTCLKVIMPMEQLAWHAAPTCHTGGTICH